MPISGKLEIVIKITEFPDAQTVENGWKQFSIQTDAGAVQVKVKPKVFRKLEEANSNWNSWVAAIAGKFGDRTADGFVLNEPSIQCFEKKQKTAEEAIASSVN